MYAKGNAKQFSAITHKFVKIAREELSFLKQHLQRSFARNAVKNDKISFFFSIFTSHSIFFLSNK
jgi:hypothetical protein